MSMLTAILQALLNGVMTGTLIAIPAVGFTAIFAVLRYPSFAVAAYTTIGAFAGWYTNARFGIGVLPGLLIAAIVAGAIGVLAEDKILAPLRPSGALTTAIGSIALNLVLENVVRFGFGNDLRGFDLPLYPDMRFAGLRIGAQQIQNLILAVIVMALVFAFLRYTRFGRAMRAVADNADLARLKGIDPRRIAMVAVALGAALAGIGGYVSAVPASPLLTTTVVPARTAQALASEIGSLVLSG